MHIFSAAYNLYTLLQGNNIPVFVGYVVGVVYVVYVQAVAGVILFNTLRVPCYQVVSPIYQRVDLREKYDDDALLFRI